MRFPDTTSATAADQRQESRRTVLYRLDVLDVHGAPLGFLIDLTSAGMRVRCTVDSDLTEVARLRIEFPRWMELGTGLTVEGRFVWTKELPGGRPEGGFVFAKLGAEGTAVLDSLMDKVAEAALEDGLL
jgi:hypothetical protein